jgi:hypothetical protein
MYFRGEKEWGGGKMEGGSFSGGVTKGKKPNFLSIPLPYQQLHRDINREQRISNQKSVLRLPTISLNLTL